VYAPSAAARAASVGAHREGAVLYASAVRFADDVSVRAGLLDSQAREAYLAGEFVEAAEACGEALVSHRAAGAVREGAPYLKSAELYDIKRGTWSPTGRMSARRNDSEAAIVLGDGKVLVSGGHAGFDLRQNTAELYHPKPATWTSASDTTSSTTVACTRPTLPGSPPGCRGLAPSRSPA